LQLFVEYASSNLTHFITIGNTNITTAAVPLLHLFFTSNAAVLLMEAQKYFSPQGAGYPSYATGRPHFVFQYKEFQTSYSPCFKIVSA